MMNHPLGNITPRKFLAEFWQKKPLVIRGAFPDFEMPFAAEELAGLALDTEAPTRIIAEHGFNTDDKTKNKPWQVKHPPLTDEDFITTPNSHWTFLVNDLERYVPELGNLIEPFRFIPDWRIDDLMVSYAADQGSVGPHVDEYDVFLIQGQGKRRWQISTNSDYPKALLPNTELAILQNFNADEEFLLDTGDMLYLPPNMPHYGVAEGECITFSVGFRAPRTVDLLQNWIESLSDQADLQQRYRDPERQLQNSPAEISAADISRLSQQMLAVIDKHKESLPIFLGKTLSEARGDIPHSELTAPTAINLEDENLSYSRESWLRLAFIETSDVIHLFANGEHIEMPLETKENIRQFSENYHYEADLIQNLSTNSEFKALFTQLLEMCGVYADSG